MDIVSFARSILEGTTIESKLLKVDSITFGADIPNEVVSIPGRAGKISFSDKQLKFPKGHFHLDNKKAMALSSFANHELLAIEMMAASLLLFPHDTQQMQRFKLGIVKTLKDEQKHFVLYQKRLESLGYEFGDFPVNNFFWKQMKNIKTPENYLSIMALTFEAANLDFAHFYEKIFKEIGDDKTANILKVVYEDEISHVAFGVSYFEKWRKDKSLWQYYNEHLPFPLTAARSKGKHFVEQARVKAKMDQDFINKLKTFDDGFNVTKRKEWK